MRLFAWKSLSDGCELRSPCARSLRSHTHFRFAKPDEWHAGAIHSSAMRLFAWKSLSDGCELRVSLRAHVHEDSYVKIFFKKFTKIFHTYFITTRLGVIHIFSRFMYCNRA